MPGYAPPLGGLGSGLGTLDTFGRDFLESNPQAAYFDYMAELGLTGTDPMSQFAQGRYNDYYQMYTGNLARNAGQRFREGDPNQFWTGFMRNLNPQNEFKLQAPQQRGIRSSETPRLRWLTSVI